MILALILSVVPQALPGIDVPTASAHNLQTKMVYMFFDPNTQTMLDTRISGGWVPGAPLLQVNDQLGIIIKVVPKDGTNTGVGGHVDFYVPNGTTVVDAAYLLPGDSNPGDGISGYDKVPMKGQSLIATGAGPIGAKATTQLIGLGTVGPNVLGFSTDPVVTSSGLHRGSIAGVYGDTGIFYATDPDTSYGSWQRFTGDPDQICGLAGLPGVTGKTITNNSGDVFVPCNKWDAEQMYAWGVKGTTYAGAGAATAPIVDYGDGRGNAPWGFASGVGGPQSGYAWNFNWDEWAARPTPRTAQDMRNAMGNDEIGPWQRIRYTGSRIASDQPGSASTALGIASVDGGSTGYALSPSNPLPATTSQTDTTSPKAVRWAVGQLTNLVPEFVWIKIKVNNTAAIVNTDGCPVFNADTFGGDAGGSDNGKDHLWRYYEPSRVTWNGCLALGKPATKDVVKVGDTYQYKIKVYNAGTTNDFAGVLVKDTLPSGVQFISAFPAQNSGPNPLVWNNIGLLAGDRDGIFERGEMFEATVTVKATGTGVLENLLCVDAPGTTFDQCAEDDTSSGSFPMLKQGKTASVTTVAPGNPVQYTIQIDNIGSGATSTPITVLDYLPAGFTFASKDLVTLNGANLTATTTVNTSTPGQALFTVPGALNAGQSLIIRYTTNVPLGTSAGTYCNSYTTTQGGTPLSTGSLACITVGAGAIGDTLFRDWNGNGLQDPEDEGIAGVTVELQNGVCTPGTNCPTTTSDANGNYVFEGLAAGTYTVKITDLGPDGLPGTGDEVLTGYTQTFDPNGVCPGAGCDGQSTVTLTTGQRNMDQDFGFEPGGAGSIGDTVWKDDGSGGGGIGNGAKDGTEPGIANVTVYLYEDTNGNGAIDADDALVATDVTDANGIYGFSGLAVNLNYLVKIDEDDPNFVGAFGPGPIASSTGRLQAAQPTTDTPAIDTIDFGYYQPPPAAVGDTVCIDTNGDRLCTDGTGGTHVDTPLPNIEVAIYRDLNRNGTVDPGEPLLGTDVTDANGVYGFTNLAPGAYVVEVDTADPDLPGGLATTRNPQGVNLASGETNLNIDFPFVQRLTKAVRNVTTSQNPGTTASPGDTLEYKITPSYTGSNLLSNLKITDTIPTGTTFVSAAPIQSSGPDPLVWNLGSNTAAVPGVGVLCPAELNVYVDADTWIDQDTGSSNNLKIYGGDTILTTRDDTNVSGQDNFALMRFPIGISTLPAGSVVEKATLNAFIQGGDGAGRALNVYELTTAWVEGTANGTTCNGSQDGANWAEPDCDASGFWASGNATTGFSSADYDPTALGSLPATDNIQQQMTSDDLTQLVEDWVAGTNTNEGLAFFPNLTEQDITLHAKEGSASPLTTNDAYITIKYLFPQTGACTINTDGLTVYSANANASQYRAFNGTPNTWGAQSAMQTFTNKQRFLQLASGTTRNESIAVAVLDDATVAGQVWNGTAWSFIPNPPAGASGQLGTVSTDTFYSTDVAYESASGDAVVVWDNNTQTAGNKLRFATYNGTTWSAAASITSPAYAGDEPLYVHLDGAPEDDSMVLVVNDLLYDDHALVWDGSAWGNGLSLDTSGTAVDDRTSLYAAYEHSSGDAMVVYAKHNDAKIYYRIWNGTSWTAEASLSAPSGVTTQPQWLVLGSDSSSDRVALGVLTTNKTVWLSVWSGTAWGSTTVATTGAQTKDSPVVSVAFESLEGSALAVYGEGKNVRYRTWNSVSNAWTGELNGPVLADNTATLLLDADPNSNEIMLLGMGSGSRLQAGLWNGSAWGALTQLSGNTNYSTGQPFDFHWQQNFLTQSDTKAALTIDRSLVTDTGSGEVVQVVLTAESSTAGTVTANALTVTSTGGAGATCGAASPAGAQPIAANGQVQFTYSCTVTASAIGSVTFKTTPTAGGGAGGFVEATSRSVLATPPLTYQVTVDDPATVAEVNNTAQIGDGSGTIPPTDSNETQTVLPSGSIGDFVWYDTNGNGLQDETNCSGSPCGAPNATVVLVQDLNNNGVADIGEPVIATAVTDSTGAYLFDNLPPGKYVVQVSEQEIPSPASGKIGTMVGTTGTSKAVTLALGQNITTVDFGFIEAASVEGTVFHDANHNGVLDPGETVLPGVQVTLTGTDLAGNLVTRTMDTDANGEYFFLVPPGSYTITYDTADTASLPEPTTPTSINLVANAGVEYTGLDFGVDNRGRIGDRVWNDANGDGIQTAGEPGLANVTLYLCLSTPCNAATAKATTATDSTGAYQFVGLPNGPYVVAVETATVPAGFVATGEGDPGTACGGSCDSLISTSVAGGSTVTDVDFGYKPPVNSYPVSGTVWEDVNGNGQSTGENGIPGVTVCLYDSTGTNVVACTTTDASGNYTFPGIPNGNYIVRVDPDTLPSAGFVQTGDPSQPGVPCTTCDNQNPITVTNGPIANQNFGYQEPLGSISGTICQGDGNGDCVSEPTLSNVPVFLTYAGTDGIFGTPDDQVFSTATDGSGNYSFPNLPGGLYQVTKSNPAGTTSLADADGGNPNNISISLAPGQNKPNQDFEVKPAPGSIGDRVWLDTDGDGVQDIGEPGLPNVVVELQDGVCTPGTNCPTAVTDMNGNYLFTDVPAGNYQVDVVSGVPANLVASPGTTDPHPVTLTAGQSYLAADFGYTAPAASAVIGDYVWADVNANGIQDPGEAGIGGVSVALKLPDGTTVATVTTDPDGSYLFTNVAPGQYLVQVSGAALAGYGPTTGPQSEGATTSTPVTVAAGDVVTDVDFGFDNSSLHSISDRVWFDSNRNGTLDSGESGIGGVTVNLLDNLGNVIATTTSNPDGTFTFPGVPNGSYTIQISDNTGQVTDLQPTTPSATAGVRPVVVSGASVTGTNFGYAGLGPIGDTIWSDADGDGVQDPGELGISGVTVNLYFDDGDGIYEPGAGDVLIATATTDAAGQYLFNDLPQGAFWVSVTPPGGYTQTGDPSQPGVPCTTCDNRGITTLTPIDPSDLDMDFGYRNAALNDVSGTVWNDTNADAMKDGTEPRIKDVTVNLVDAGGKVVATTTTDSNGYYTFFDVPPGNYKVVVTDEANVLDGYTLTSGLDAIPVTVTSTPDTNVINVDFGYVRNPATGAIGDTVWNDANRDGVQNGAEPGLPNVVVELKDGAGNPIDSDPNTAGVQPTLQTTDMNGRYLFTNLPAGNYTVDVVSGVPSGMAPTPGTTDPSAVINLSAGELYPDADFGYASQTGAAMGDFVWHDVDGDGIQDPGEPGIGGVSIQITPPAGVDIGAGPGNPVTVVTDADGSWLKTGLPPGNYSVVVTPPGGYNATPTNGSASRAITMPATGEDVMYVDFGFNTDPADPARPKGVIGDTIYLDANGNGTQDVGEPGIAGVTVSLLSGGTVIASTVTDANGAYSFPGLPDGTYTVVVTDVNNVLAGLKQTEDPDTPGVVCTTCNNQGTGTVVGGAADDTVDFGYAPVGGAIGNQVWHDKDGDGLYEPTGPDGIPGTADDESGMQGVLINLYLDTNNNGLFDPGIDNLVRTTTTDVNGQYQFTGLPAGKYLVDVASSNTAAGGVLEGLNKTTGPTPGANNNSQADPYLVTLTSTGGVVSSNDTADFGYDAPTPYSIAGTVFDDISKDGVYQPGTETPIPGATVTLYRDLNGDGVIDPTDPVIGSMISDTNGDYLFTDLPPGKYIVSTNALATKASGGFQSTQTTTTQEGVQPVTILSANVVDQDFGFYRFAGGPLAINLAFFTAAVQDGTVELTWETVSEIDLLGFDVYRATSEDGPWTKLNETMIPAQNPGASQGNAYQAADPGLSAGQYWYRLDWVEAAGVQQAATTQVEVGSLMSKMWMPMVVK